MALVLTILASINGLKTYLSATVMFAVGAWNVVVFLYHGGQSIYAGLALVLGSAAVASLRHTLSKMMVFLAGVIDAQKVVK